MLLQNSKSFCLGMPFGSILRTTSIKLGKGSMRSFAMAKSFTEPAKEPKILESNSTKQTASQKLAKLLEKELRHELAEKAAPNPSLAQFLEDKDFKLIQSDGCAVVELRKVFKKENLTVRFSILDLQRDCLAGIKLTANVFSPHHELPIKVHFVLTKPGHGSILFDSALDDTFFSTYNVLHYPENSKVKPTRAKDTPHLKKKAYVSEFIDLEDEVKEAMEIHLEYRGVDDSLAKFIREYAVFKEQNEYVGWLSNIRKFMLA